MWGDRTVWVRVARVVMVPAAHAQVAGIVRVQSCLRVQRVARFVQRAATHVQASGAGNNFSGMKTELATGFVGSALLVSFTICSVPSTTYRHGLPCQ